MTKEQKSKYGITLSASFIILLFISFGAYLNNVKADRNELLKIDQKTDRNCEKIEKNAEFNHRLENVLIKVETLLEERTKRESSK